MMTNLFSSFDPSTGMFSMNWISSLVCMLFFPLTYWYFPNRYMILLNKTLLNLNNELNMLMMKKSMNSLVFMGLFMIIFYNNLLGLFPYIFTSSSHLVFTMSLALPLWLTFMLFGWINNMNHMFCHLVPMSTPGVLMPFMGLFLSMHYSADIMNAFNSVNHICKDVNYGWMLRVIHANGTSLFFICVYLHVGRGLYYGSYKYIETWSIGVIILLMLMATAFLGYVLPWGQMSFWGATVITNLMSAIPYLGGMLVNWIWGGFAVDNATLTRFYSLHFIMPFVILALSMIHLIFLHQTGSNNPLGVNSNVDKISFHPYFSIKDMMGYMLILVFFLIFILVEPYLLGDPDNFTPANPLITPKHIQPEWYFLFAYAILRSIPNKLGGVLALFMSIFILIFIPFINNSKFMGMSLYPMSQMMFWYLLIILMLLTWIGARPVESPYINVGMILTVVYFSYYLIDPVSKNIWDSMIN